MDYAYLNSSLIKQIIESGKVDCLDSNSYFIGSIGDVIFETDHEKETFTFELHCQRFDAFRQNDRFFIQDLSKEDLVYNMFEEVDDVIEIDRFINRITQPHFSINYLALKPSINSFWEEDILFAMIESNKNG